jgi:hypothetical protein
MTKREQERRERLLPGGVPRYVRCYDNGGKTCDRYTVVFSGRYGHKTAKDTWVLAMSENPFHPQGVGMHCPQPKGYRPDYPTYSHLGRKIKFEQLPEPCRRLVMSDYVDLWDLKGA